jgi:hypothetical protein
VGNVKVDNVAKTVRRKKEATTAPSYRQRRSEPFHKCSDSSLTSLGPGLVQDPEAALPAPDGISTFDEIPRAAIPAAVLDARADQPGRDARAGGGGGCPSGGGSRTEHASRWTAAHDDTDRMKKSR